MFHKSNHDMLQDHVIANLLQLNGDKIFFLLQLSVSFPHQLPIKLPIKFLS